MANARPYEHTALVIGILSSCEERRDELFSLLSAEFGPFKDVSSTMDFPYTDYYDFEMSGHPVRYLVLFENLIDPSELAGIKIRTNALEKQFLGANGRRINLDPGILSLSNFILATCKDRSHRIPLQHGVYGEVTLIYQDRDFQRLPWTYADYSSEEVKSVLRKFRTQYKSLLSPGK